MSRSLGLAAYRAMIRRGGGEVVPPDQARPPGELVWIHAAEGGNMLAIQDLAMRLCAVRAGLNVLITLPEHEDTAALARTESQVIVQTVPAEHMAAVKAFHAHWQPDCCIWVWGALRPNLVLETGSQGCPQFLIDADSRGFDRRRDRWLSDLTYRLLSEFDFVLARSEAGLQRLLTLGLPRRKVEVTSPLVAGGQALPCVESDLTDLSAVIAGRPIWFAAQLQAKEFPTILSAHRQAVRLSHRLLLVLQPADPAKGAEAVELSQSRGFATANWSDGTFPDETTQVLITEDSGDRGLFFRLAPVSFLGSSLVQGESGCDPFDAAALGSAVLYGPKVRDFMGSYTRLAAAGAARIVNDADALGTAVSRLIAPDQAATMAHAGWDVISQGAALMDRVTDLVQDALDDKLRAG
ncbi:3-deoxy-D-manno-octulosonic acid transferase [Sulfitobacter alexandrii]|uniref:3-deoxy-D-manno-octulosonic acid transferase n=1 Tax=Sulfitobacter alexandrii TaxID=1917485 RepID=A0A1J0WL37_9RHOB|nr:glycosyltransferase N-terminal domain-containing protein [Sulfitobacter alexandrii]APE44872.1 3-deoxy-D-manno-octulosonic acid transferase [Sulfitobacter alexandrii]